jgi:predicted dehydrogenase
MRRPRIGFLGLGWIGRHRMEAILATGAVEAAAIADPSPKMMAEAVRLAPAAVQAGSGGVADGRAGRGSDRNAQRDACCAVNPGSAG